MLWKERGIREEEEGRSSKDRNTKSKQKGRKRKESERVITVNQRTGNRIGLSTD